MSLTGGAPNKFDVRGIFWRKALDWAVLHIPAFLHSPLIGFWTLFFFVFAAPERRSVYKNLIVIFPDSSSSRNWLRAFRVFHNYAWTLTDSAVYRLLRKPISSTLSGENFLNELGAAKRGMMLTAHMGSYDLGAGLFVERFHREIRMVRAPELDELAAHHVDLSFKQTSGGAVKIDYSTKGSLVAFDLLGALRAGHIISIQGDRVIPNVTQSSAKLFGHEVFLPTGPFVLALVAETPIYPVFIVRTGFRAYRIIAHQPITCLKEGSREEVVRRALEEWSTVLEKMIRDHSTQWFAFTSVFES